MKNKDRLKILLLSFLAGILISCDPKKPPEFKKLDEHFSRVEKREESARKKIEQHFEGTDYRFEVSNVAVNGTLPEGKIEGEDLLAIKFTLMVWVEGAETLAKAEEVDRGLREIFSPQEVADMTVYYVTGWEGESQIIQTLKSLRGSEKFWQE